MSSKKDVFSRYWKGGGERAPEGIFMVLTKAKLGVRSFSTGWIIQKDRREDSNKKGKGEKREDKVFLWELGGV